MVKNIKSNRGGARPGAGRPRQEENTRLYTFRAGGDVAECIDAQENKTEFIKSCISATMAADAVAVKAAEADFSHIGEAYRATDIQPLDVNFFDIGLVAGFPIPLDNDERAKNIELLQMLCPYPESSYLIRVQGESMIDAGIHSGDIVIVDKSQRNPTPDQVAVCELNGEYTLKRFEMRGGTGWLIPANPKFPEIMVTSEDSFSIWGVVTYIIHRPKGTSF